MAHCCSVTYPVRKGTICFIVPPFVLEEVSKSGSPKERQAAIRALTAYVAIQRRRDLAAGLVQQLNQDSTYGANQAPQDGERWVAYDADDSTGLPGRKIRGEGDPAAAGVRAEAVNEAYDGAVLTHSFYKHVFQRDSIDGQDFRLVSSVHYDLAWDNAMWNGTQMVYGDGSDAIIAIGALTKAVDVIGHELTHGLTQMTAGLEYRGQSGALNESFSDVFGSLVKQYHLGNTAEDADWLIGDKILGTALHGRALRDLKDPGTAFNLDRQPGHMNAYVDLPVDNDPMNDNGGVHINSGIPNRAFYLAATTLGGPSWEKAGQIWYVTLAERLRPDSDFYAAANATVEVAGDLYGARSLEQRAVRAAWQVVGVL
jgi:Zn-dependent metalloprotease